MALLCDHAWKFKYDPDDGPLVEQFYIHALEAAVRYDRTTGFFSASALALAARGVETLVRNSGHMRMLVGCTLDEPEVQAIARGESLRDTVVASMLQMPLVASDSDTREALELLSWMIARGYLDVKVAIPCSASRQPLAGTVIFHEKAGVIEDKTGDRLAFSGSINETAAGWKRNWESFHVFCSWNGGSEHIEAEEESFARLWEDRSPRAMVMDAPEAVKRELLRFLPDDEEPARLVRLTPQTDDSSETVTKPSRPLPPVSFALEEKRRRLWDFIWSAPRWPEGVRIGEATSAVTPWPHQTRAFERMYDNWPPRLLIADEVGLGKTIEAGLLLRQAWMSGRAKRILVLAPKAVLVQWQNELREKFNLNWPIYDGKSLNWYPSRAMLGHESRPVSREEWVKEPFVIASSQLMRRRERQNDLLTNAEPWDLVILDEAHHARRKSPGQPTEGGPNLLLLLMQGLSQKTQGLVLLTATPMQVHPVEVWDLLTLLRMPPEWNLSAFLEFFDVTGKGNPSHQQFDRLAQLFQSCERSFGQVSVDAVIRRTPNGSQLKARRILSALRDSASTPRRQLDANERRAALAIMRAHSPVSALISRYTRELLRHYFRLGTLTLPIANRRVTDEFLPMTAAERKVYDAVEDYISTTYNNASEKERSSVGFVMTIYRRRLASSFFALSRTLQDRLTAIDSSSHGAQPRLTALEEDLPEDGLQAEPMDTDEASELERQALQFEEKADIERLLDAVRALSPDTKAQRLLGVLGSLRAQGYPQAIVFTQYTDTLDFLRDFLRESGLRIMCYSGRGGELLERSGEWRRMLREETKRRFKAGEADVLVCTDAAAEGLNFQFCGALVNFDCPWNPMRIEQRIGRVDRLGQRFPEVAIVNLLYDDTVETDVYRVLRTRIGLFTSVVGRLQPILSTLPARIVNAALAPVADRGQIRSRLVGELETAVTESEVSGFDLDEMVAEALGDVSRPVPPYGLAELHSLLTKPELLPKGVEVQQFGSHEFVWSEPGLPEPIRITTDPDFYEEHPESVEFWTPGNPLFPVPTIAGESDDDIREKTFDRLAGWKS